MIIFCYYLVDLSGIIIAALNLMKIVIFILFWGLSFSSLANGGNKIQIDINELSYKLPENRSGVGGNLIFPRVRLTWDDLKLSLDNHSSFLDAQIKVTPTYINFKTTGVKLTLPLEQESLFFKIDKLDLKDSYLLLNPDYLSFTGDKFIISDGNSVLRLDKYSLFCVAPKGGDMTSVSGAITGCLYKLKLKSNRGSDLAGAAIEYKDVTKEGKDFILKTTLESFTLLDSYFDLNLENGSLKIEPFLIKANEAHVKCYKDPKIIDFKDPEKLKNSCINEINIEARNIKINNHEDESIYYISLDALKTQNNTLEGKFSYVILADKEKATLLEGVRLSCYRFSDDEFYDLHKIISGCLREGDIEIKNIRSVSLRKIDDYKNVQEVLSVFDKSNKASLVQGFKTSITDHKVNMKSKVKYGVLPKFKVSLDGYFIHEPSKEKLTLKIEDYKAFKIFREGFLTRGLVNLFGKILLHSNEKVNIDYPFVEIEFKKGE